MTLVRLQNVSDIPSGTNPVARVRGEPQRNNWISGDRETVLSDAGRRSREHWLTTNGEETLTCTFTTRPYRIGEHGPASFAECGVRFLAPFCWNSCAGIIRRRLKQQVRDRL